MKKLILSLFLLLTFSVSFADITSENEHLTLLCQADKITGFQWRDGEWQFTKYKPVTTIIKKHDDEKSAEDDDWVEEDAVNIECAFRQSGRINGCYSIKPLGAEVGRMDYVSCTEWWGSDDSGNSKVEEVYCNPTMLEGKWQFQINGEFVATKGPYGLSARDGIKDDVYIQVGKCSLL
jgi:hypothetical protein|tara:strand:+ start:28 stop:561 length:534 start_codon:yes stop_codon:yes gene_type:complete